MFDSAVMLSGQISLLEVKELSFKENMSGTESLIRRQMNLKL